MSPSRLSLSLVVFLLLPVAAQAQGKPYGGYATADMEYCARLSELYIRYVGRAEGGPSAPVPPDVVGGTALAQCKEGRTDEAIPVLERKLRNARITLPPRS